MSLPAKEGNRGRHERFQELKSNRLHRRGGVSPFIEVRPSDSVSPNVIMIISLFLESTTRKRGN